MGAEQSSVSEQNYKQIHTNNLKKRKSVLMNIANKLLIDPIQMSSLFSFLEKYGYIINDQELGKGGSGTVFCGETTNKEPIAIKIVKCRKSGHAEGIIKEFNLLKTIKSANVVSAVDLLQFESQNVNLLITIMEKCECNLTSYLRKIRSQLEKNQLSEKIYEICMQLIKGLNDIHNSNILHLDIKPSNIMLGRDGNWKFIDMGISIMLEEQHFINSCGMTQLYSSPEQYRSNMQSNLGMIQNRVTKQSDIFSLGLVFAEMTGVILDRKTIMQQKQIEPGQFNIQLNPSFSTFNTNVITKMLQHSPERRPTTEYIERQISSQLFQAQFNSQLDKSNPTTPQSISLSKTQSHQMSISKVQNFSDVQTTRNSQIQNSSQRFSTVQTGQQSFNYGTSHILKSQNLQSDLQKNSYNCQHVFNSSSSTNQSAQQSPCNQDLYLQRKSEFYPHHTNTINTNQNYYENVTPNYRFSTYVSQQQ